MKRDEKEKKEEGKKPGKKNSIGTIESILVSVSPLFSSFLGEKRMKKEEKQKQEKPFFSIFAAFLFPCLS